MAVMFLRYTTRKKNGKEHRSYSLGEIRRVASDRVVQRHALYLTEVEAAFKNLKDNLALRPIYHQLEHRIEAHIFICFLAYGLHVTLRRLGDLAPVLTPRAVLEKFATVQMLDVHLPTADERTGILSRYTHPETDVQLLLQRLKLELPAQPPPKSPVQNHRATQVL